MPRRVQQVRTKDKSQGLVLPPIPQVLQKHAGICAEGSAGNDARTTRKERTRIVGERQSVEPPHRSRLDDPPAVHISSAGFCVRESKEPTWTRLLRALPFSESVLRRQRQFWRISTLVVRLALNDDRYGLPRRILEVEEEEEKLLLGGVDWRVLVLRTCTAEERRWEDVMTCNVPAEMRARVNELDDSLHGEGSLSDLVENGPPHRWEFVYNSFRDCAEAKDNDWPPRSKGAVYVRYTQLSSSFYPPSPAFES